MHHDDGLRPVLHQWRKRPLIATIPHEIGQRGLITVISNTRKVVDSDDFGTHICNLANLYLERRAASVHVSTHDCPCATHLALQLQNTIQQRLGRWRTTRYIDIHWHDPVAAAHHRIAVVVIPTAIRARPH